MTTCPACGSAETLRILWGLPAEPIPDDVWFGGCRIPEPEPPDTHCIACSWEGRRDEEPALL